MNKKLSTGIQVALGFLLGAVLDIVFCLAGVALAAVLPHSQRWEDISIYAFILIGVVQLIWQVPAVLLLRRKGHKSLALGVILAASLLALLNATCWGLLQAGKIKIGG